MSDIDYFHDSLDEEIIEIKKPTLWDKFKMIFKW
jgi:hypothetical protein